MGEPPRVEEQARAKAADQRGQVLTGVVEVDVRANLAGRPRLRWQHGAAERNSPYSSQPLPGPSRREKGALSCSAVPGG